MWHVESISIRGFPVAMADITRRVVMGGVVRVLGVVLVVRLGLFRCGWNGNGKHGTQSGKRPVMARVSGSFYNMERVERQFPLPPPPKGGEERGNAGGLCSGVADG